MAVIHGDSPAFYCELLLLLGFEPEVEATNNGDSNNRDHSNDQPW